MKQSVRNGLKAGKRAVALCLAGFGMGGAVVAAAADRLPITHCINMGNSLEAPTEAAWGGKPIEDADFTRIAAAGFDTVRLPVRWDTHAGSAAPYAIDPAYLARVRHVVGVARQAGLNVILNSHHFEGMHSDPIGNAPRLAGIWGQIAAGFASEPTAHLWFELENEPHDKFTNANLIAALSPALAAIRKTNPDRPVIIGGEYWSGIDSLATLALPDDPNIFPTFHYYEPFDFTHQGATWVDPSPPLGRVYGNADDKARLGRDVQKVRDYAARTNKWPFMGESGAHTTVSLDQRVAYHRAVADAFGPLGIGICQWAYSNTFPFYDREKDQWLAGLLPAIGLKEPAKAAAAAQGPASAPKAQPTAELQALDDALPGTLINDPSRLDWQTFGGSLKTKPVKSADIPGGGGALQFAISTLGATPYDAGANVPIRTGIARDRDYVAVFYARAIASDAPDGKGRIGVRFQQNAAPYGGFGDKMVLVGPEWQLFEVGARSDRDIAPGTAVVGFQLSGARQTIEIGQTIVVEGVSSIRATMAAGTPAAADPELPPQLAGKGVMLNDPADRQWLFYGANQTTKATTTNVYGRVGTLFTVASRGTEVFDAGANVPIAGQIAEGDRIRIAFLARTVSADTPDGQARLGIRVQTKAPPYDGFADNMLSIGPNWRLYQVGTQAPVTLAPGTAQLVLHLAGAKQAVEIGPVYILREELATSIAAP